MKQVKGAYLLSLKESYKKIATCAFAYILWLELGRVVPPSCRGAWECRLCKILLYGRREAQVVGTISSLCLSTIRGSCRIGHDSKQSETTDSLPHNLGYIPTIDHGAAIQRRGQRYKC